MLPPRHPATRYDAHRQHPNQHPMGKTQRTVSEPMLKVGLQKQLSFNENAKMDLKQEPNKRHTHQLSAQSSTQTLILPNTSEPIARSSTSTPSLISPRFTNTRIASQVQTTLDRWIQHISDTPDYVIDVETASPSGTPEAIRRAYAQNREFWAVKKTLSELTLLNEAEDLEVEANATNNVVGGTVNMGNVNVNGNAIQRPGAPSPVNNVNNSSSNTMKSNRSQGVEVMERFAKKNGAEVNKNKQQKALSSTTLLPPRPTSLTKSHTFSSFSTRSLDIFAADLEAGQIHRRSSEVDLEKGIVNEEFFDAEEEVDECGAGYKGRRRPSLLSKRGMVEETSISKRVLRRVVNDVMGVVESIL